MKQIPKKIEDNSKLKSRKLNHTNRIKAFYKIKKNVLLLQIAYVYALPTVDKSRGNINEILHNLNWMDP